MRKHVMLKDCFLVFFLVWLIMLVLYFCFGYAPFGNNSLVRNDASFQYIDLLCYFKDVLLGDNNVFYTFSKALGGNNVAAFSYYLSSPANLLVLLFDKSQMLTFFDLVIILKLSFAAVFFVIYLKIRFKEYIQCDSFKNMVVILLSLSYALCQYSIAQSSNIMWLDGVYMLPLIMLGVHRLVCGGQVWSLSVPVAIAILFNWYSGGIDCLFSIFYLVFELIFCSFDRPFKGKEVIVCLFRYILAMGAGVLCSSSLFLPTIAALRNGVEGGFEIGLLKNIQFIGSIPSAIQGYSLGAKSSYGKVALFSGNLPLLGCLGLFFTECNKKRAHYFYGICLLVTLCFFYWRPFYILFGFLKESQGHVYRYSYLGCMVIIIMAAINFLTGGAGVPWAKIGNAFGILIIVLNYLKPDENRQLVYYTAFSCMILATLLELLRHHRVNGMGG